MFSTVVLTPLVLRSFRMSRQVDCEESRSKKAI